MPCVAPNIAYRATYKGGPVTFKRPQQHTYETIELPCGTCELCRAEQARQQAVRIIHEQQMHDDSIWITLTYNDEHLPQYGSLSSETPKNARTIDRYSWQRPRDRNHLSNFWKRLRNRLGVHPRQLRYYVAGEYGDESLRPHYHACLFGTGLPEDAKVYRTTPHRLWTSKLYDEIWGHGEVKIGALTFETARYTASYVIKKLRHKQRYTRIDEETGELLEQVQPRAYMSRNLGRAWWDKYRHQVSAHDHVIINGRRQKPPRAYDRWLKERSEIVMGMINNQRQEHALSLTPEQTRARAENARAHARMKSKSI